MNLLQNTFYINLDHRTDRLEHVRSELQKIGVTGERFSAIQPKSGALGCTLSHIRCLEMAKDRNYDTVFICEDDITFLDPATFLANLHQFENNTEIQWDVLLIAGNNAPPFFPVNEYCVRVLNCQTTTGYVVKKEYYDTLLNNFKESAHKLIMDASLTQSFALDIHWKKLQAQDFWYMIIPLTVVQYGNYSDIEQKNTDFSGMMLDLQKAWLLAKTPLAPTPPSISSIYSSSIYPVMNAPAHIVTQLQFHLANTQTAAAAVVPRAVAMPSFVPPPMTQIPKKTLVSHTTTQLQYHLNTLTAATSPALPATPPAPVYTPSNSGIGKMPNQLPVNINTQLPLNIPSHSAPNSVSLSGLMKQISLN